MKKALVAVLLALAVVISIAGCGRTKVTNEIVTDKNGEKVTDANGEFVTEQQTVEAGFFDRVFGATAVDDHSTTTAKATEPVTETKVEVVTNAKGETVTNKSGEAVTSVVSRTKAQKEVEAFTLSEEEKKQLEKAGFDVDALVDTTAEDVTMSMGDEVIPEEETSVKKVEMSGGVPAASPSKSYREIISGKVYTMKATVTADGTTVPLTVYSQGSKYATEATVSGIKARFVNDGTNMYLVLPALRAYLNAGSVEDLMGENSNAIEALTDPSLSADGKASYVQSATATINGKTYDIEEYKTDDGTIKYYYLSGNIKRIEMITSDGTTSTIIEIQSLTDKVDSSVFSVSGYKEIDEETFNKLDS